MEAFHKAESRSRQMNSGQHVLEGIACLETEAWQEALGHFDRAIAMREGTDWKIETSAAWGLAAAHINRSDALRRLNDFPGAIHSLHQAIHAMAHVPLAEHPAYPERLILAWINLATAFGETDRPAPAEEAFSKAFSLLETWGRQTSSSRKFLSAMFHTNRARFHIGMGDAMAAWENAGQSVRLLDSLEQVHEVVSASIRARGILCQSLALILEIPNGANLETDWIARATDAAEEALGLALASKSQSEWIFGLVRYCAKIYRVCQPHFLGQFLIESIPPNPPQELLLEMQTELLLARADLESRVIMNSDDTELVHKETQILSKLRLAEAHFRYHCAARGRNLPCAL